MPDPTPLPTPVPNALVRPRRPDQTDLVGSVLQTDDFMIRRGQAVNRVPRDVAIDAIARRADADEIQGGAGDGLVTTSQVTEMVSDRLASQAEAEAGSNETALMTPLRTRQGIHALRATTPEARGQADDAKLMTPAKVHSSIRVLVEHANIRETRFAGGAPMNGIDDDGPAIRAAIAWAKTQGSLYGGGGPKIKLGSGQVTISSAEPSFADRHINIRGAHKTHFEGEGDGQTTVKFTGNRAGLKGDDTVSAPLYRFFFSEVTFDGPGNDQVHSHLLDLGASNNCQFRNNAYQRARTGVRYQNAFHTEIINPRMNRQGGLALFDGIFARDGDAVVQENAIGIFGGRIFGCLRWGFRGETVTGSYVDGLEVLGCGEIGVYFGDSPAGRDLKWFTWHGGLLDTCPDLLVVKRGSASVAELVEFSGLWVGYPNGALGPSDIGTGIEFDGLSSSTFHCHGVVNCDSALIARNCTNSHFAIPRITDYNRKNLGAWGVTIENTTDSVFDVGPVRRKAGVSITNSIAEAGTSARNTIRAGSTDGLIFTIPGNSSVIEEGIMDFGGSVGRRRVPNQLASFGVADLPGPSSFWAGKQVFVHNGRKPSEGAGAGTGVVAVCDGVAWRRLGDYTTVVA